MYDIRAKGVVPQMMWQHLDEGLKFAGDAVQTKAAAKQTRPTMPVSSLASPLPANHSSQELVGDPLPSRIARVSDDSFS